MRVCVRVHIHECMINIIIYAGSVCLFVCGYVCADVYVRTCMRSHMSMCLRAHESMRGRT